MSKSIVKITIFSIYSKHATNTEPAELFVASFIFLKFKTIVFNMTNH